MAEFIAFNEGKDEIGTIGMPAITTFALSRSPIAADPANPIAGELNAVSGYANRNEPVWSGASAYARIDVATPAIANGIWTYTTALQWLTGLAVDGQADVVTLLALDKLTSKLLHAESLAETTMSGAASGATALTIAANPGTAPGVIVAGTVLQIGAGVLVETKTVLSITGTAVTLSAGLTNTQPNGARVLVRANMAQANSEILVAQPFHRFLQNVGGN